MGEYQNFMGGYQDLVPIAEYASRWEADVAAARLREAGCEASVLADPATAIALRHASDSSVVLAVRYEAAGDAADLLGLNTPDPEAEFLDAAYHHRRFSDRPAWVRFTTWVLLAAIPGPFAVVALWLLWKAMRSLYP